MKDELLPATRGASPLLQRDYWAVFAGCALKPSAVMAHVKAHFCELPPVSLVQFVAPAGLHANAELDVRIVPAQSCRVRVTHEDPVTHVRRGGRLMAEWCLWSSWSTASVKARLDQARTTRPSVDAVEEEMTGERGWDHYSSEAIIANQAEGDDRFSRARVALANYEFSDPAIVLAHFDPSEPLLGRCMLLEIQVLGLHYLCPVVVGRVREEPGVFGFRYDTLDGHIERGVEWFLLTKDSRGEIRFRVEARWRTGQFPNWWSRLGFIVLSPYYQRTWHRRAHRRLSLLAHYGSTQRPPRDPAGLTHQGIDVQFTYHTRRRWFT